MLALKDYGSGSSSSDSESETEIDSKKKPETELGESTLHLKRSKAGVSSALVAVVKAAPDVEPVNKTGGSRLVAVGTKEVNYNPKYEDLFTPVAGPANPFKSDLERADKNMLSGKVEPAHFNEFQFEVQRRTFHSYGFAQDPSSNDNAEPDVMIGSKDGAELQEYKTVFEDNKVRPKDKRKRKRNDDPADIEGYLGPWAKFEDEETVSKPSEEDAAFLEDYLSKMKRRGKKQIDEAPIEEKTQLHIKDPLDYQGRSFLHIPQVSFLENALNPEHQIIL